MRNRGLRTTHRIFVLGQRSYQLGALVGDRCPGFSHDLACGPAALIDLVLQFLKAGQKLERVGRGQHLMYFLGKGGVDEESTLANATGQIPERGDLGLGALKVEPDVGATAVYVGRQFRGEVPLQGLEFLPQALRLAAVAQASRGPSAYRRPRHTTATTDAP